MIVRLGLRRCFVLLTLALSVRGGFSTELSWLGLEKNDDFYGVRLGLLRTNGDVTGVDVTAISESTNRVRALSLVAGGYAEHFQGLSFDLMAGWKRMDGLRFSVAGSQGDLNGVTIGLLGPVTGSVSGISVLHLFATARPMDVTGVLIGDHVSVSGRVEGITVGILCAKATELRGLQVGLANSAQIIDEAAGQIGLHNYLGAPTNDAAAVAVQVGGKNATCEASDLVQFGLWNNGWATNRAVAVGLLNQVEAPFGILLGAWNQTKRLDGGILGVVNLSTEIQGVAVGAVNLSADSLQGMQIGLYNFARFARAFQVGAWNEAHSLEGLQLGLVNRAIEGGSMCQIGAYNEAGVLHGLQAGLLNRAQYGERWVFQVGVVNLLGDRRVLRSGDRPSETPKGRWVFQAGLVNWVSSGAFAETRDRHPDDERTLNQVGALNLRVEDSHRQVGWPLVHVRF